jgi:hypothetical protein
MRKPAMGLARIANPTIEVYAKIRTSLLFGLFSILILSFPIVPANAATFTVTNTGDSGSGSLRQAVLDANSAAGADTIEFAIHAPATIILTSGELSVTTTITINGDPVYPTTISGNNTGRVFNAGVGSSLTLNHLNITEGRVNLQVGLSNGGGIQSLGDLFITNCAIFANTAQNGTGGGIYAIGNLTMTNATISGNTATISGGGLEFESQSSIVSIRESTITLNTSGTGGGVHNSQAQVTVRNTIIAGNTATVQRPDYSLNMISGGYNIIGNTTGTTILNIQGTDQTNTNPNLLPLALNGGATRTHAFSRNSAANDRGFPTALLGTFDQRGAVRNADGDRNGARFADVGAYELQPVTFDFDGGRQSDLAVTRDFCAQQTLLPPEGCNPQLRWFTLAPGGGSTQAAFGLPTDIVAPGDYDADSVTDIAVWRPSDGNFYVLGSSNGFSAFHWGMNGDIPVPAEYNAQGITEYAVYRGGTFHIFGHLSGYYVKNIGAAGDKPAVADYDGDSKTDVAVFNNGAWKIEKSTGGMLNLNFGTTGDVAVPADYDGDGKANIAVFRPSNGTWYILAADNQTFTGTPWGLSTDKLVPADYDGDGKSDIAVFRAGNWYILNSRIGFTATNFGAATDTPVESSFIF